MERYHVNVSNEACAESASLGQLLRSKFSMGFSLIEVMVVIAIVGILAAIAAPSFTEMLRNNRASAAASALQVSLNLARSEAIKRGSDARVTVAANTTAGTFTNGWAVFVDRTLNANSSVAPTTNTATLELIEVVAAPSGPLSFSQTFASINSFTYDGRGRGIDVAGAGVINRQVWFFDGTSQRHCLVTNNSGRVYAVRTESATACPTN